MKAVTDNYTRMVDRLARVTTSGRRIRELDGLRFIAIATVFLQHVYQTVLDNYRARPVPARDWGAILIGDWHIGVELFFVISGFILAMPFAQHHLRGGRPVSLKAYYWRRVTRLEPPYVISMLLWFSVLVFYSGHSARALLPHLIASLCYAHNFVYREFSTINSVAWSLEIEVQFYILAPLLACVYMIQNTRVRRAAMVGGAILIALGYRLLHLLLPNMPLTVYQFLPLFLAGFLLADLFLVDWKENPQPTIWGDMAAIPGWLLLPLYFEQGDLLHHTILPAASFPYILFLLCWASFRSRYTKNFLASSFIMTVGGMCYSIYLLHFPLIKILGRGSHVPLGVAHLGINTLYYSFIWGIPVLGVSILYFLGIEKPCMRKDWPVRLAAWLQGKPLPQTDRMIAAPATAAGAVEAVLSVPSEQAQPLTQNQPVP